MRGIGSPKHGLFSRAVKLSQVAFLLALGCSTQAVAIQECREIEALRCKASVSCGIVEDDEVDSCKRFYKEQCLHGIAGDDEPSADEQKNCRSLLEKASEVAAETQNDDDAISQHDAACAVIAAPWDQPACEYLNRQAVGGGGAGSESESESEK